MNRYTLEGVARDVHAGKKIAVVSHDRQSGHDAFFRLHQMGTYSRVLRSHGRERLETVNGGRVTFHSAFCIDGIRGIAADVVLLDECDPPPEELMSVVLPVVSSTHGEVIRA